MTKERFEGKTAIITGAATGIGFAIAQLLIREGASVILNDSDAPGARAAAEKLNHERKGRCLAYPGDASQLELIDDMVTYAVQETGKVDLCVANAGITVFSSLLQCTPEDYRKATNLNLQGSFFLTQKVVQQMQKQGSGGRILLMSSVAGVQACPNLALYSMTKAALSMMARSLVTELGPMGIGINAIAPGATITERTLQEVPNYEGTWSQLTPNLKVGKPEDVAEAAAFLLSEAAKHVTGQTLIVDGGWSTTSPYPKADIQRAQLRDARLEFYRKP